MDVQLDAGKCLGYGNCVVAAPDLFDLDASGIGVILRAPEGEAEEKDARRAATLCPVRAITLGED